MLALCHLRAKILNILVSNADAQADELLLTLCMIDALKPGELRLLQAVSEVLPHATMSWLHGLISEARQRVVTSSRSAA